MHPISRGSMQSSVLLCISTLLDSGNRARFDSNKLPATRLNGRVWFGAQITQKWYSALERDRSVTTPLLVPSAMLQMEMRDSYSNLIFESIRITLVCGVLGTHNPARTTADSRAQPGVVRRRLSQNRYATPLRVPRTTTNAHFNHLLVSPCSQIIPNGALASLSLEQYCMTQRRLASPLSCRTLLRWPIVVLDGSSLGPTSGSITRNPGTALHSPYSMNRCRHKLASMPRWLSSKKVETVRTLLAGARTHHHASPRNHYSL